MLGVRAARTLGAVVGSRILFRLLSGAEESAKMVCADKAGVERRLEERVRNEGSPTLLAKLSEIQLCIEA